MFILFPHFPHVFFQDGEVYLAVFATSQVDKVIVIIVCMLGEGKDGNSASLVWIQF